MPERHPPFLALALAVALSLSLSFPTRAGDTLYQSSVIDALLAGVYDGPATIGDLRAHGDFGIGTVNRLDGELVALDGEFYQITADASVHLLPDETRIPFASVTQFETDATHPFPAMDDFAALRGFLDAHIGSLNVFHAIRIHGTFPTLRLRSVPAQTQPYPPLPAVIAKQSVWDLKNSTGTLVGFRSPAYAAGVTVPGYHFHFISDDRKQGGHVLELTTDVGTAHIDTLEKLVLDLPTDTEFLTKSLAPTSDEALQNVERGVGDNQ